MRAEPDLRSVELQNTASFTPKLCSCFSLKRSDLLQELLENYNSSLAADLIQDMYLKELRAYKPPQQKASDSEGHVQKFTPPAAPKSPEESNLASEMKEYEDQVVEIEGSAAPGEAPAEDDFFEDIDAIDAEDREDAHH